MRESTRKVELFVERGWQS